MTTTAIVMLLIAIIVIWGGLAAAIVNLATRGDAATEHLHDIELHRDL